MNLEALQVFLTVVKHGSFAGAAADLSISRATASKRVEELEAAAGIPLVLRTPTGIVPTPAGGDLAARGRHVLAAASALLSSSRQVGAHPSGLLRLLAPVGLPVSTPVGILIAVMAKWPDLRVQTRYLEDPLAHLVGSAEVALTFNLTIPPGPWDAHDFLAVPDMLAASPNYLATHPPIRSLEDLSAHRLLMWHGPGEEADHLPLLDGGRIPVVPTLISNRDDVVFEMASKGHGIAFIPRGRVLPPDLPYLEPVLQSVVGRPRWARLVVPHGVAGLPRVRVMIDAAMSATRALR